MNNVISCLNRFACGTARGIIRLYQLILSPALHALLGGHAGCRHQPTCSHYALECFRRHPFPKAAWLTIRRVGRCHPWGTEGMDPVPD